MSIEDLSKIYTDMIIEVVKKSRERFLKTTPPLTWIWENRRKLTFALTLGGQRIYSDPTDDSVAVRFIQGDGSVSGVWDVEGTVNLTQREIKKFELKR